MMASLETPAEKVITLRRLRRQVEVLKKFIRICHELRIIELTTYIKLSAQAQEISKMGNGWLKYVSNQNPT